MDWNPLVPAAIAAGAVLLVPVLIWAIGWRTPNQTQAEAWKGKER